MKIIFFGSDDFAQAHLEAMLDQKFNVVATVTQPDRPKGRGMKASLPPIKLVAQAHQIDCLQPKDIKDADFLKQVISYGADLFVVIAYGRFLPQSLLDVPRRGAINVHGSLLPKYRGAAPINWAILEGENETGVTVMYLNKKMDAGEMIAQAALPIDSKDTAGTLRLKMIEIGKKTLIDVLKKFQSGEVASKEQNEGDVTFAPKLTKELGQIDWINSAEEIERKVRGLLPWPGAYTFVEGKMLKILDAQVVEGQAQAGEIMQIEGESIDIGTGKGLLRVHQVHLANAKPMPAAAFLRGQRMGVGDCISAKRKGK